MKVKTKCPCLVSQRVKKVEFSGGEKMKRGGDHVKLQEQKKKTQNCIDHSARGADKALDKGSARSKHPSKRGRELGRQVREDRTARRLLARRKKRVLPDGNRTMDLLPSAPRQSAARAGNL